MHVNVKEVAIKRAQKIMHVHVKQVAIKRAQKKLNVDEKQLAIKREKKKKESKCGCKKVAIKGAKRK